ncbi:MAG: DUF3795 domain-containing protein [Dehalococcoidia bacterium]|nr:DUF3795 domain-containing protein [Dehalococcoidia bacterium]
MANEPLVAVCGLYCNACTLYRYRHDADRKDAQEFLQKVATRWNVPIEQAACEGCLSEGSLNPNRLKCEIRKCAMSKPGVTRCADCAEFPCEIITKFSNDGVPHHAVVLKNIQRQRKIGIFEWNEEEFERVRCQVCGVSLDWYAKECHRCGTVNPGVVGLFKDVDQPHYRA